MAIQNIWDPTVNPAMGQWTNWDPTMAGINNFNTDGASTSMAPTFNTDPAWLASLGFTGPIQANYGNNTDSQSQSSVTSPELQAWLRNNGYNLQLNSSDASHGSKQLGRLVDAQGNQIGQGIQWGEPNDDAFGIAALLAGGFAGATAAGVGVGATTGGTAATTGGATGGGGLAGTGLPEYSAYTGAGSGGTLTASSGEGLGGALGSTAGGYVAPTTAAGIDSAAGTAGYGASSAGLGGGVGDLAGIAGPTAGGGATSSGLFGTGVSGQQAVGGVSAANSAGSAFSSPSNAAQIDSAAGTPGYGASSSGTGGGAGDLSGISGPSTGSSLGTQLQNLFTNQQTGGLSGFGQSLLGLGVGGLTGALGKGNTGLLNQVNYGDAATAQGQSQRTNQTNAQGSLTYNQNGVDVQGHPTYSQNVSLNAPYQQNLNQALGNQSTALGNLNSYNQNLPSAYANAPSVYGNAGSQQALAQQQQDAMYDQQKRYLDPQYDLQSKQLQAQLANQGVSYGSDAYNNAMTQFGSQQNQAYGTARDSAINSGNQYANTLFNQNLQANQLYNTNLNNQGANYSNQASGALNGVVQNPTFAATPTTPTPYLGGAQLQGNANLNQYNAQIGNTNNLTNGLTGIGQGLFSNPGVWSSIGSGLSGLFGGGG